MPHQEVMSTLLVALSGAIPQTSYLRTVDRTINKHYLFHHLIHW